MMERKIIDVKFVLSLVHQRDRSVAFNPGTGCTNMDLKDAQALTRYFSQKANECYRQEINQCGNQHICDRF